jgi:hypothetical protein
MTCFQVKWPQKFQRSAWMRRVAMVVTSVMVGSVSTTLRANTSARWLAFDLTLIGDEETTRKRRENSTGIFHDEVVTSVSITQNIRNMMDADAAKRADESVDIMQLDADIDATAWLKSLPKAKQDLAAHTKQPRNGCRYNAEDSRISCGRGSANYTTINVDSGDVAPRMEPYGRDLVARIAREGASVDRGHVVSTTDGSGKSDRENDHPIMLTPRRDGLVTVVGGSVRFSKAGQSKKVKVSDSLSGVELSIFVRDPSTITWDETQATLTAHKPGRSEIFVVTPNRISIIEAHIDSGVSNPVALASREPAVLAFANKSQGPSGLELANTLVSLDGLDMAAGRASVRSSNASMDLSTNTQAQDLPLTDDVSKLGREVLNGGHQFIRGKARAAFESIRLKIVDDRSELGGQQYPVSGVRVKIAGTEFSALSNNQGEIEVRDVPAGARLLLDISDERGYIMPQVTEVSSDRDGVARSIVQVVQVRRFASLDLAARSGGVVQDMSKSSFCGRVTRTSTQQAAGVRVSLDVKAMGPFYFNHLGFVDLSLGATAVGGKFCFFNVESGPVSVAFSSPDREQPLSGIIGLVAGRHSEEVFDLSTARYLSTTLTTIASATEQLGADEARAIRHDLVEQADIYAIGSGQLMVPIDEGLMTTPSAVLPSKGRVWTVSASSDFETTIQGIAVNTPTSKQISTLVPNGFMVDMAVFAQQIHNSDQGSVVVEHGHLSGATSDGTKMRLVDPFGRDAGDGWYFADHPVSKAVFFNVPPGIYSLVVETATGHWIAADTVMVYSESVSFAKTGGQLEKL